VSTSKSPKFAIHSTQPPGASSVLDELTGGAPTAPAAAAPPVRAAPEPGSRTAPPESPAPRVSRDPIRVQVPRDLADRVRGAIAALAYRVPEWASLNVATAAALEQLVSQAEREHNNGEPFPWQPGDHLLPGRRVGH
jgi:hypothetical protein